MSPHPSILDSLWSTVPPEAQAAIVAVIASLETRIAELEQKLNLNSTNSSKPPSSDSPAVKAKRRPPPPPSGRSRGGHPGHERHTRALVPPEHLREIRESVYRTGCEVGLDPGPDFGTVACRIGHANQFANLKTCVTPLWDGTWGGSRWPSGGPGEGQDRVG